MNKSFLLIASYFFLVVHLGSAITQRSQDVSSHQYVHLEGNGRSVKEATLDNDIPEGEILTEKQSLLQYNTLAAGSSPPPPCVDDDDCFCKNFYDLTLIIDESGSIGTKNWQNHVIPFTDKIIKDLHISENEVHAGILLFSNFIRDYVTFDQDESYKKDKLLKKVDELKKIYAAGAGTKIVSALDYALEKYIHHKKARPSAPKVTILFTDGNDTSPGSVTKLPQMGLTYRTEKVKLLVLGVAEAKDINLRAIVGCAGKNAPCPYAMKAEWETINAITKRLTNKICHTEDEDEDIITGTTTPPQQISCQGDKCLCEDYYDLTLILDESGSITPKKWKTDVVPFAEKVVSNLNISKDKIHLGIMRFAVEVKEDVSYAQETRYNKNALINVVKGLKDKYGSGQGTRLVDALEHSFAKFTKHPNSRSNAPKVTILFTDGNENYRWSWDVRNIGLKYRKENVRLIVVGVYKATINSLKMLAGCSENEYCPQVIKCDWDQLTSITDVITDKICDIDAGEVPGSPNGSEKPGSGGVARPDQQNPPSADRDECYCKDFYDLTLILDESASIGDYRWGHEVVPFATQIVKLLHVGYNTVHVGLLLFAESRRDIVRFSDESRYDKSFLLQKIESLKGDYRNGKKTFIVQALEYALANYTKGSSRVQAPKVTMIFTDGNDSRESDETLYKIGLLYRREKVKLLVLGVSMADENKLRLLVGCTKNANCPFVIKAEWGQLPSASNEFVRRICSSGPVIPPEVGGNVPPPLPPLPPLPPQVDIPIDPELVLPQCQGDECLCHNLYDLTLILDESASIGSSNWKKQVYPFVEKLVNNLVISESKVHVGIMLFAKHMRDFVKFSEKESYEKDSLMRKVPELKSTYKAGTHTYIVESLEYGLQHYTKGPNSRENAPKVTILFTDGNNSKSGDEILSNVSSLYKKENVKLLVLGVGAASIPKLRLLGGCHKTEGDCPTAVKIEWDSLKDISQGMVDKICNTDTEITPPPSTGGSEGDGGSGSGGEPADGPPSASLPPPGLPCQDDESCAECDDDVCNNDPACKKVFDIAIVLDQSRNITNDQWKKYMRPFSTYIIKSNYLAKSRTHVTIVKMGRTATVLWELGRKASYKKNQMIKKVNTLVKSSSSRKDIARNLKHLREKVFGKKTSSPSSSQRRKLIIMLVEGKSDTDLNELRREVALLKVNNIDMFVYAIDSINDEEYRILGDCENSSSGLCKNAVKVTWDNLLSSEEIHSRYICNKYPADAECAEWGDWSACPDRNTSNCNNLAVSKRERKGPPYTLKEEEYLDDGNHMHGSSCTDLKSIEYRSCPVTEECNDVCGDFGEWSQCSATCGDGIRTRHRAGSADETPMAAAASFKDDQADSCHLFNATEVEPCNVQDCDSTEVCEDVGEWGEWSPCSKTCGYSTRSRTFVILPEDKDEYAHCSTFEKAETEVCSVPACEDEKCFEWEDWTEWSAPCGPRKRVQRARLFSHADSGSRSGGSTSSGSGAATRVYPNPDSQADECELYYQNKVEHDDGSNGVPCTDNPCGSWSEWSECDRTCNVGMRMRRFISNVTGFVGEDTGLCLEYHNEIETEPCLGLPLCDNGECNDWETWVDCGEEEQAGSREGSTSCHAAPRRRILTRKLQLLQHRKANTSNFCSDYNVFREEECPVVGGGGTTPCNDALCNEWEDWGDCSTTCGTDSFRVRRRKEPLELIPPSEDMDGKMGMTCEQQNIRIEEREACSMPACESSSGGAGSGSGSGSGKGSTGSGSGGMGTGEKVSLAAGIIGLAALGVGGMMYGYKTLTGGEAPHSSNMEFENVETEGAEAEKSNEDFEVIDADDSMWN
ncbi:Uncharacterized protein PCOAH_00020860 [Plasmodium coatneyi]|uniref:VWFA domain-containing protein n=1 Tax=Plasmodium coatneyi TaxID=208452 RepID=A0A1B1DYR2_9APIC|nr:Uncharacterized protein PCOAH_00020860 [Plasmodium coatneyi]ANQ07727.1 Uncharacterized protein PCOAH_00020860 [Plasmodium coatneyi]